MIGRRRPLMRAAMVGGGAYYAGKRSQERSEREYEQEARLQQLEAEQAAPPRPASSGGMTADTIEQLKQLGELKESGVLTEAEFQAQKQKILQGV